jgi:hypothetical protein
MMLLSEVISRFEADFYAQYGHRLLPSHHQALQAMKSCRTEQSAQWEVQCSDCGQSGYYPHSCGHRLCPHCQHHEGQRWLQRQAQKLLPVDYFLITFTLPAPLRSLAWDHQRLLYGWMFEAAWDTLSTFSHNDRALQGTPGVTAVLHTHSRELNYHPHIHALVPAGAIDTAQRCWRSKGGRYLFNHKALAKVFRAKLLEAMTTAGLAPPAALPTHWVVDCRRVGSGEQALRYLGTYLYRGVIREHDILECTDTHVTYRYQSSKPGRSHTTTLTGVEFLWRVLQHTLPKGFRRARDYGLLHPNSKMLIRLPQYLFRRTLAVPIATRTQRAVIRCPRCGAPTVVLRTRLRPAALVNAGATSTPC